tara:strand:- start:12144 stop:12758 length:615 start_codon:yes stop_codon:yes gene_type:complete
VKRQKTYYLANLINYKIVFYVFLFCFTPLLIFTQNSKKYTNLKKALENIDSVFILDLSGSKISIFPEEIIKLSNLQSIILKNNKLTKLPASINKLTKLESIDLSKNKFEDFPVVLSALKNVKKINLNRNLISEIPDSIKYFKNLEYLDLWSNEINYISQSIRELENLKEIDLRVIMFSIEDKNRIKSLLPNCKIHFSNSCNCGY